MLFDVVDPLLVSALRQTVTSGRKVLQTNTLLYVIALTVGPICATAVAENSFDLSTSVDSNEVRQARVIVEVTGKLNLNADGQKVTRLPFRVAGDLLYDERTLSTKEGQARRDIRHYRQAAATISVGGNPIKAKLPEDRRLIVVDLKQHRQTLFSPLGPLSSDDLDLLDVQGSTTLLNALAPPAPVGLSDEWQHDDQLVAALLGLDAISQSDVKSKLKKVEGEIAILDLVGTVSGAIDGVASDIRLKAKYNIDLARRQVTWLAMSIRENRAIGHASPGFDVTARIRVALEEQTAATELSADALAGLPLDPHSGATLLSLSSAAGSFQLLHARNWQVMIDRHDVTVLRMIEQGDLVAQCNISSLPDLPRGKQASIESFRADIERALGVNFGQFAETTQGTSSRGLRVLRAVVDGAASELPIRWIYYHISDEQGRQAALVFTMDAEAIEEFAAADSTLISSFEFLARGGSPTPATRVDAASAPDTGTDAVNR